MPGHLRVRVRTWSECHPRGTGSLGSKSDQIEIDLLLFPECPITREVHQRRCGRLARRARDGGPNGDDRDM